MKFSIKDFFSKDFFTEEILNRKLHFLCSEYPFRLQLSYILFQLTQNIVKHMIEPNEEFSEKLSLCCLRLTLK